MRAGARSGGGQPTSPRKEFGDNYAHLSAMSPGDTKRQDAGNPDGDCECDCWSSFYACWLSIRTARESWKVRRLNSKANSRRNTSVSTKKLNAHSYSTPELNSGSRDTGRRPGECTGSRTDLLVPSHHAGNESGKSLQQSASLREIHAKLSVPVFGTPESQKSPRSPHMTPRERLSAMLAEVDPDEINIYSLRNPERDAAFRELEDAALSVGKSVGQRSLSRQSSRGNTGNSKKWNALPHTSAGGDVRHELNGESKAVEAEASGGMMDGEWGVREPIAVFRARSKPRNQNESLDIQRSVSAGALDDHDSFLGPTPGIISRNLSMDSLAADICFAGSSPVTPPVRRTLSGRSCEKNSPPTPPLRTHSSGSTSVVAPARNHSFGSLSASSIAVPPRTRAGNSSSPIARTRSFDLPTQGNEMPTPERRRPAVRSFDMHGQLPTSNVAAMPPVRTRSFDWATLDPSGSAKSGSGSFGRSGSGASIEIHMKAETVKFDPKFVHSAVTPRGASGRPPAYNRVVGEGGGAGGGGGGDVMIERAFSSDGVEKHTKIQTSQMPRFIRSLSSDK